MAAHPQYVNLLFEERMADIRSLLHTMVRILNHHQISYELVGGMAVFVYVEDSHTPELASFTRDVDLMVHRADLEHIIRVAEGQGFTYRHVMKVDMLIPEGEKRAVNAVHLIFSGEKTDPAQLLVNPAIEPQEKSVEGKSVPVIGLEALICMKLSAFRLKDQVHIKAFDSAGLISPAIEKRLDPALKARLAYIRSVN